MNQFKYLCLDKINDLKKIILIKNKLFFEKKKYEKHARINNIYNILKNSVTLYVTILF